MAEVELVPVAEDAAEEPTIAPEEPAETTEPQEAAEAVETLEEVVSGRFAAILLLMYFLAA